MNTATFVKVSRKALNLTQEQLSPLINKKRTNISMYESGKTVPPGDVVLKIIQLRFPEICLSNTQSQLIHSSENKKKQTECQKKSAV